jgi:hypothetical protein
MATIQQRKGPNGVTVYRVQVRRKDQPAQSATFTKITDARKWATRGEGEILSGRHFKPIPQHTVAEMIDRYLAEVLPHKHASTIPNQTLHLHWWRHTLGYAMLVDVSPAMVADCREVLVKRFSGATANRYLAALSHAFTIALKEWG